MKNVLLQTLGFFLMIISGYLMKKAGLFKKEDGEILAKIIVNLTLPAALILALAKIQLSGIFFILILIGLSLNILMILAGHLLSRRSSQIDHIFMMFCVSGYNVGNFTIPFVQGFFPAALPFLCMADIGNTIMTAGGSNVLVQHLSGTSSGNLSFRHIARNLSRSVPFMTYFVMLIIKIPAITLSDDFLRICSLFANANGFLSMFMIGLYLNFSLPKAAQKHISKILSARYLLGAILAGIIYLIKPFSFGITISLMLLCLAPVPTFSIINSVAAGVPHERAGLIGSISILISLVLMTLCMSFIH